MTSSTRKEQTNSRHQSELNPYAVDKAEGDGVAHTPARVTQAVLAQGAALGWS